jgi:hypothetical protein
MLTLFRDVGGGCVGACVRVCTVCGCACWCVGVLCLRSRHAQVPFGYPPAELRALFETVGPVCSVTMHGSSSTPHQQSTACAGANRVPRHAAFVQYVGFVLLFLSWLGLT